MTNEPTANESKFCPQCIAIADQHFDLVAEVERLKAELAEQGREWVAKHMYLDALRELERLRGELAEAKRDAERYKWLRTSERPGPLITMLIGGVYYEQHGNSADSLIDTAIGTQ